MDFEATRNNDLFGEEEDLYDGHAEEAAIRQRLWKDYFNMIEGGTK